MSYLNDKIESPPEAFGQSSAGRYVMGILVALSMICSGISLAMWNRSHNVSDAFYKDTVEGRVAVRSIYGRLIVTQSTLERPRGMPIGSDWNYARARVPRDIIDGWQPGFWKSIGIQRGVEFNPNPGVTHEQWLRVRWPTLAAISGLFPAIYILRRSWRERAEEKMEQEFALK